MPDFLDLAPRTAKPRRTGLTHVIDRGLCASALEALLAACGEHIDFVKFGWGTAYVTRGIARKVSICKAAGVRACPGGTLFEIAVRQNRLEEYAAWLKRMGFEHVEVSDGTLPIDTATRRSMIERLATEFTVLAEVGAKSAETPVASDWIAHMEADLAAGASWIVTEGRESGTVGLYDSTGEIHGDVVDTVAASVPPELIIFEAPQREQQAWFVHRFGPDVSLGNIASDDVAGLETLRRGLRYDTIDLLPLSIPETPCR